MKITNDDGSTDYYLVDKNKKVLDKDCNALKTADSKHEIIISENGEIGYYDNNNNFKKISEVADKNQIKNQKLNPSEIEEKVVYKEEKEKELLERMKSHYDDISAKIKDKILMIKKYQKKK